MIHRLLGRLKQKFVKALYLGCLGITLGNSALANPQFVGIGPDGTVIKVPVNQPDTLITPDGREVQGGIIMSETPESFAGRNPYAPVQKNPFERLEDTYSKQLETARKIKKEKDNNPSTVPINWGNLRRAIQHVNQVPFTQRAEGFSIILEEAAKLPAQGVARKVLLQYMVQMTEIAWRATMRASGYFVLNAPATGPVDADWKARVWASLSEPSTVTGKGYMNGKNLVLPTGGIDLSPTLPGEFRYRDAAACFGVLGLYEGIKRGIQGPLGTHPLSSTNSINLSADFKSPEPLEELKAIDSVKKKIFAAGNSPDHLRAIQILDGQRLQCDFAHCIELAARAESTQNPEIRAGMARFLGLAANRASKEVLAVNNLWRAEGVERQAIFDAGLAHDVYKYADNFKGLPAPDAGLVASGSLGTKISTSKLGTNTPPASTSPHEPTINEF